MQTIKDLHRAALHLSTEVLAKLTPDQLSQVEAMAYTGAVLTLEAAGLPDLASVNVTMVRMDGSRFVIGSIPIVQETLQ